MGAMFVNLLSNLYI